MSVTAIIIVQIDKNLSPSTSTVKIDIDLSKLQHIFFMVNVIETDILNLIYQ